MPTYLDGVVVEHLVERDRQVGESRFVQIGYCIPRFRRGFIDYLVENFDAGAMAEELRGGKELRPLALSHI